MYTLCAIDDNCNDKFFVDEVFLDKNARVVLDVKEKDVYLIIFGKGYITYLSVRLSIAGQHILPCWALEQCIEIYFAFFQDQIFHTTQKAS